MAIVSSQFITLGDSKILLRSFELGEYEGMELPTSDELVKSWSAYKNHPTSLTLGAFFNGRVIAHLRAFQPSPHHPWVQHIVRFGMAVSKNFWGRGLGTKLIDILEQEMQRAGIKRIEAEVRTANLGGVELYKKNGYKIEGTREKAALINGEFLDEYYIAKLI